METKFDITLTCDEEDEFRLKSYWHSYDIPIDINSATGVLILLAHQFIDLQDEQQQNRFEKELMKKFKVEMCEMCERFDKLEELNDDEG